MEAAKIQDQLNTIHQKMVQSGLSAVDQIAETGEKVIENSRSFLTNLPEQGQKLVNTCIDTNREGVKELKEVIKSLGKIDYTVKDPRELAQQALSVLEENVNRSLKIYEKLQTQGEEAVAPITEKLPEAAKDALNQVKEATSKGLETLKSTIDKGFDMASKAIATEIPQAKPAPAAKPASKSAAKKSEK